MAKNQERIKKKLLEELEKIPIVQYACQKVGISRSTYYRWIEDDKKFSSDADDAQQKGVEIINDMAESKIINKVQEGQFTAITFWLKHNHSRYRSKYLTNMNNNIKPQPIIPLLDLTKLSRDDDDELY